MDPTVIGTRLASSVVGPLVKKLFVQEGPGAGLVDRPVRLSGLVSFRGEKRTLTEKDVRKLAARLVKEAVDSPGEQPFPPDETTAVTDALTARLLRLGDVDMDDVQAVRLGYRELARTLQDPETARGLSADASYFLDSLTEWACVHVVNFFTQRSTFVARTLVEQSQRQDELIARIDELITRIPRPGAHDVAFERRYLDHVAKRHGQLTIYGIDLVNSLGKWPLDVAYLSLEVAAPTVVHRDLNPQNILLPDGEIRVLDFGVGAELPALTQHDEVQAVVAEWLARALIAPLPADQILHHHDRVLLRGVAGSGKTTLVQWLAVSATRTDAAGPMSHLYGRIPLVLPLRTLTRHGERLPTPDGFLKASGCPLAAAQPEGWADRVLERGRGLVLIDGIDEIPEAERARARTWLGELITAYPDNRWLVTSRPSAVQDDWLADDGFTELTLSAMSPAAVATFIEHWHKAAATGKADEDEQLRSYEQQLLTAIRSKPDLGRLATNPLMCGLICALHRDRRGYLPQGRKELYESALAMLLTRRDRERDVMATAGMELQQEPQTQLLQRLAYWLIRNGRTELDRDHAERIIADALPAVPSAAALGDAKAVFRHLLDRSGLLRKPAPDAVDFIHRTFQDYLGARAAVEVWDVGLLIEHAADDQWEDVIRMSIAHARPRERAEILSGLLEKGDAYEPGRERSRVFLLAAACLEHAAELDPGVRAAVEERTSTLIPAPNMGDAVELAAVGPLVLELLPAPQGLDDNAAFSVVTTATNIASDAAIPYLARFADHRSVLVKGQLQASWLNFDAERYAQEVLAHLPHAEYVFLITNTAQLRALRSIGGRPLVTLRGPLPLDEIADYLAELPPRNLTIEGHPDLADLSVLARATGVSRLSIADCPRLTDLSVLPEQPLEVLKLSGLAPGLDLRPVADLDHLQQLDLGLSPTDIWSTALLPAGAPLRILRLGGETARPEGGLTGLDRFENLLTLRLSPSASPSSTAEWGELLSLPQLTTLQVSAISITLCLLNAALPQVTQLFLDADDAEQSAFERIPSLFPALTHLSIHSGSPLRPGLDLTPLKELTGLESLWLPAGTDHPHGLDQLSPSVEVSPM
ncbi:NACHT domain-containing protein [Streptomyces sp. S.PB5]|uniref:NACHT domain-containing protein n=1 Tax=Streptomyces sp. S.PB5 TaxID=3020844 RepID=UPI0025B162DD|nr:NACHT domain-containing protein [Streptomyces sp. S.PB5]MDN3026248.1 NACHT domain-containing protein [Streptomyces sp. S.PB5]